MKVCKICSQPFQGDDDEHMSCEGGALPFGSDGRDDTCEDCRVLMDEINASIPAAPEKPKSPEGDRYAFFDIMPKSSVMRQVPERKVEESEVPESESASRRIVRKAPGPRKTNSNKPRVPAQSFNNDAIDFTLEISKVEKSKTDDHTQSQKWKTGDSFLPMKAKKEEEAESPRYVHLTTASGSYIDLPDSGLGSPHLKAKPMITRPEYEKHVREGAHREISWGEKFDLDDYSGHIVSGVQGGPAPTESAFNFMMNIIDKQKAAKDKDKASKDEDRMEE